MSKSGIAELVETKEIEATGYKTTDILEGMADGGGPMTVDQASGTDDPGGTVTSSRDKTPTTSHSMDTVATSSSLPTGTTDRTPAVSKAIFSGNMDRKCLLLVSSTKSDFGEWIVIFLKLEVKKKN